ncbi:MAG TPA: hypothetical protein VHZ51_18720 [Ktedonobacteraceae bacterium]|nr:hypothetical protein [Ktedonobacteraceae bacterium]
MNSFSTQHAETNAHPRRRSIILKGLWLRLLFALIVGILVVMALFATNAVSH